MFSVNIKILKTISKTNPPGGGAPVAASPLEKPKGLAPVTNMNNIVIILQLECNMSDHIM